MKNQVIKWTVKLLKPKSPHRGEEKRFLILSTTGLGDTLWGTPAIRCLRESFPASYIGVLTSSIGKECLQHNTRIDELFVIDEPLLRSLFPLYLKLKKRKITHVLSFHTSQRLVLPLAAILGAQKIIGTRGINKDLDFLLTVPLGNEKKHEIQRRLDIIAHAGAKPRGCSMEIFLSEEDKKIASHFLNALHLPANRPLIALHPGAKDGFKQWPPSHFVQLGNRLVQNLGCHLIVTGTPSEKPLVESIVSQIDGATAATHLPLRAIAAVIKQVDLMITNDTGPMHLSLGVQTATIGLFTPTDPRLCGPYCVENALPIAKKTTCSPCLRKKCQEPFCLLQIGVQEVYDAALRIFYQLQAKDRSL